MGAVPTESSFLARMARASRERVRDARRQVGESALLARALATAAPPSLVLERFDLIAELKLRSPASGELVARSFDFAPQLDAYAAGGAAAVSVLTEPEHFEGRLEHLELASQRLAPAQVPTMRKDFLTDPYQVIEARAAGAGGVLVILSMLDDAEVRALLDCARELGLFVLLEAFDRADLDRAAALAAAAPSLPRLLLGVNCRDLKTLEVRFERFAELAPDLPGAWPSVAESGITSAAQVSHVVELGYRLVLAGSALMRSAAPEATLRAWLSEGRRQAELACS